MQASASSSGLSRITFAFIHTAYTVFERLNFPIFTYQPHVGTVYFWLHRTVAGKARRFTGNGWLALHTAPSAFVVPGSLVLVSSGPWLRRATVFLLRPGRALAHPSLKP